MYLFLDLFVKLSYHILGISWRVIWMSKQIVSVNVSKISLAKLRQLRASGEIPSVSELARDLVERGIKRDMNVIRGMDFKTNLTGAKINTVNLPEDVLETINYIAHRLYLSRSEMIRQYINDYFRNRYNKKKKQAETQKGPNFLERNGYKVIRKLT